MNASESILTLSCTASHHLAWRSAHSRTPNETSTEGKYDATLDRHPTHLIYLCRIRGPLRY